MAFTTYLKVAGWAIVWCLVVGTVLGALVDSRGLPPAVGTLGALVTLAASIRIVGRRYGLRTVKQWAIATTVSLGVLTLTVWVLVQVAIITT